MLRAHSPDLRLDVVLADAHMPGDGMVLLDRSVAAGQQAYIAFSTQNLPAGVYVVRATGADTDLTQRVTVRSNDEVGTLAEAFNSMSANLERTEVAAAL